VKELQTINFGQKNKHTFQAKEVK